MTFLVPSRGPCPRPSTLRSRCARSVSVHGYAPPRLLDPPDPRGFPFDPRLLLLSLPLPKGRWVSNSSSLGRSEILDGFAPAPSWQHHVAFPLSLGGSEISLDDFAPSPSRRRYLFSTRRSLALLTMCSIRPVALFLVVDSEAPVARRGGILTRRPPAPRLNSWQC